MMVLVSQKEVGKILNIGYHNLILLRDTITIDTFSYVDNVEFMDLVIFKGDNFVETGKFDISVFQKKDNK